MSVVHRPAAARQGLLALRALELWLILMATESAHGALRLVLVEPLIGEAASRRLGVFLGSILICALVWLFRGWLSQARAMARLGIGLAWAGLTIVFEFGISLALGYAPERMVLDYDLAHGGLMPLGLLVLTLSPLALATHRRNALDGRRPKLRRVRAI